jgi:cell division septation protein DedD
MVRSGRKAASSKHEGGGWILSAFGALLLVTAGFSFGLISGALWEERDLVADYVLGQTEEVVLAEASMEPEAIEEEQPFGLGAGKEREPVTKPAESSKETSPPAVSAPPPMGNFEIQVGAFSKEDPANSLARELKSKGYPVNIAYQEPERGKDPRWRVRVGPVKTRAEAESLSVRLKKEQKLPTWILSEEKS